MHPSETPTRNESHSRTCRNYCGNCVKLILITCTLDYITLHNFLVSTQCTGNSGCFPWGKRVAYSATQLFVSLHAVFSCFHTTGWEAYSFTIDGYGIFKMRTGGSDTNKLCTRVDSKGHKNCQGIEPRVFRFEFWCSNHWATTPIITWLFFWFLTTYYCNLTCNHDSYLYSSFL